MTSLLSSNNKDNLLSNLLGARSAPASSPRSQPLAFPFFDQFHPTSTSTSAFKPHNVTVLCGGPFSGKSRLLSHICALTVIPAGGLAVVLDLDHRFVDVARDTIALHCAATAAAAKQTQGDDADDRSSSSDEQVVAAGVLVLRPTRETGASGLLTCLTRLATAELFEDLVAAVDSSSLLSESSAWTDKRHISGHVLAGSVAFDLLAYGDERTACARSTLDSPVLAVFVDGLASLYWHLSDPSSSSAQVSSSSLTWAQVASRTMSALQRVSRVYGSIPALACVTILSPATTTPRQSIHVADKAWPMVPGADAYIYLQRIPLRQWRYDAPQSHNAAGANDDDDADDETTSLVSVQVSSVNASTVKEFKMALSQVHGVRFRE
ncbi:hypothetical protein BZA70DRAFT_270977 [Myxozyma melibiosi]|uniref:DNA recombination and repair protein Rad51-like C-terminal domain-containing protein n=1 Tax=Myxozyma melibiosi TaxID=54550 RepID=A0ABR1FBT2_9ASCO